MCLLGFDTRFCLDYLNRQATLQFLYEYITCQVSWSEQFEYMERAAVTVGCTVYAIANIYPVVL